MKTESPGQEVTFLSLGVFNSFMIFAKNGIFPALIAPERRQPTPNESSGMSVSVGVLALQGGFLEHLSLLHRSASYLQTSSKPPGSLNISLAEVRTPEDLAKCDALIIPGGESTTIALIAAQSGLLEPLRNFVK